MDVEKPFDTKEEIFFDRKLKNVLRVPISKLNIYETNNFFSGIVIFKSEITEWKKNQSEGLVSYVDVSDETSIIRCLMFNQSCKNFHHLFEVGEEFLFAKGNLKFSNRQHSTLENDYEYLLHDDSIVTKFKEVRKKFKSYK